MKQSLLGPLNDIQLLCLLTPIKLHVEHFYDVAFCPAFEEWAVEEGWAQLVLPSKDEATEYFAKFRPAATLNPDRLIEEEGIVQGMVDELNMVIKSVRFSAATIVRFQSHVPSPCQLFWIGSLSFGAGYKESL